ncbi:acetyltransferase [Synechococcus sp. N26]|uniref:acetyltransferase n=1 Tax=Synechococcus sp. N26 TaxID=2575513 RepID=UPI000E0F7863|nr:acetyltransferase [Synechococcus sp. N26]
MKQLLLVGCGGHARSLIELIESSAEWQIHGLVGLPDQVGNSILGYRVIGCDDDLPSLREECQAVVVAIGQLPDSAPRVSLVQQLEQLGFQFPVVISPHAVVSRYAQLGPGTTVGHGVIINAAAVVGNHCIINSRALIEHDVHIDDHCHVSTGVLVNGGVHIGSHSFIGSGAMIREGLTFPRFTTIGAGQRVMGWPLRNQ